MNCPMCDLPLRRRSVYSVELDRCDKCHGVWFAAGTIKPFLDNMVLRRDDIPPSRLVLRPRGVPNAKPEGILCTCPSCSGKMTEFNFAYDSNVFVPKCGVCGGVWADKRAIRRLLIFVKGNVWRRVYSDC